MDFKKSDRKLVYQYDPSVLFSEKYLNYDFDGFQIDFARHIPVLPVGRQWELREELTDFMRKVRNGLNDIGTRKGKLFWLSVKLIF